MTSFKSVRKQVKQVLGDLWWYTLIMFCVQRFGDVINLVVGLWLVPRYVPQSELGAVLPLTQVGNVLGLPLMIVMGPFAKFLNAYATRGEYGKVKALLRDVCLLALLLFVGTLLYARLVMPPVFERMRVAAGSLGFLIVASSVVAVVAPIPSTALQGLKKFRMITYVGALSAPLRLVTMALFLPIRGLSGYFVGQTLPSLLTMGMAFFGLRSVLGRAVKAESYWRSDGRQIVAYMVPYGILASLGIMLGAVELFVIRHRLPDLESAAYYMISRFAETGAYMGLTLTFVAFPLIAERHEKGETSDRLLWQSLGGALAAGLVLALLFSISAPWLFSRVGAWRPYTPFVPYLAVLTLIHAFRIATACFITHEMACRRFAFLLYYGSLCVIEMFTLYGLTGYRFFSPYLPAAWLSALEAFNPCRLSVVLGVMSLFTLLSFGAALLDALRQRKTRISVQ